MKHANFYLYILRKVTWITKNTLFYIYKILNKNIL